MTDIQEVAFRLVNTLLKILTTKHQGEHPRMGAAVSCLLYLSRTSQVRKYVEIAKTISERINRELSIPASLKMQRLVQSVRTAKVRKGQFEGMPENSWNLTGHLTTMKERFATAGVTAVGCPECHSSPTTSTWIQTTWKSPT